MSTAKTKPAPREASDAVRAAASIAMLAVGWTPSVAAKAPISFTAGQASMGEATCFAKCAMCHGAKLEGISGPALKGKDGNLQGQTVSAVYAYRSA